MRLTLGISIFVGVVKSIPGPKYIMRWTDINEASIPFGKLGNTSGMTFGFESEVVVKGSCFYHEVDLYDIPDNITLDELGIAQETFDDEFRKWKEENEREDSDIYDWIDDVGEAQWWDVVQAYSYAYGLVDGNIVQYIPWGDAAENLAEDMAENLSIPAPITAQQDTQVFQNKDFTNWYIEGDGSVHGREIDHGMEIVSPVFHTYGEFKDALSNWLTWFPSHYSGEIYTNSTTGLHVNIGMKDAADRIDMLKLLLFSGEKWTSDTWRNTQNEYTGEVLPTLLFGNHEQVGAVEGMGKDINRKNANKLAVDILKGMNDKSFAVNMLTLFNHGYVEFRAIGGKNYEANVQRVFDHISRFVQLIQIASDPDLYRKEYSQKLGKYIASRVPEPDHRNIEEKIVDKWLDTLRIDQRTRETFIKDGKIVITPEDLFQNIGFIAINKKIPDTVLRILIKASGIKEKYSAEYNVYGMSESVTRLAHQVFDPYLL